MAHSFYDTIREKLKKCVKPNISESLRIFGETLQVPLKDVQIFVEDKLIIIPATIFRHVMIRHSELSQSRVCKGFHDAFYKTQFHLNIFQTFKEESEGLLAQLIAKAQKAHFSPQENEDACHHYLECIRKELFALAKEFENPPLNNFTINYQSYKALATWIEKKQDERLVEFFNHFANEFTNGSTLLASLGNKSSLEKRAKQIRDFLGNCPDTTLDLSDNDHLSYLVPEIGLLSQLITLDLSGNRLTEIPESISRLTNLQELYLDHNQIEEIPTTLDNLINLQKLFLQNNQIREIPTTLGNLTKLRYLYLANNQIREIPVTLSNLTNLQELFLQNNQIREIPTTLGNLINLQALYLDHNQIREIPATFGNLTKLWYLYLDHNQIREIPATFGNLTKLRYLYLSHNQIKETSTEMVNLILKTQYIEKD